MAYFRLKHSFTAGELSPLMNDRVDFERFKNGCRKLQNMVCLTQGPVTRRSGCKFIYSLNDLGIDVNNPLVREVPFIFNELQAYSMIFYMHTDGRVRMVLGTTTSDGVDGLVVYGDVPIAECPPGTPVTPTPGYIVSLTFPVGWDLTLMDWAQSADEMYIAQSGLPPHIIKRWDHECWELIEVTFTDQPADWSDNFGWPERVTFHQQRLVYAANILKRQTVWMSKAGDFNDFGISSTLVDSDAVTFTLDSGTQNKIQWITSGKSLHVGTLGNEWTVQGNDRTSLTPSNILAQRQTSTGCEPNKPLLVGLTTLFVERHGRTVNEFVYDYTFDSYKTSDMAILSPHVTEKYSISDWTYQQSPDSIIWCIRTDGHLLGITYQRQHKVVGWHQHDTDGEFKAVTAIPGNTREDDVWFVVKRQVEGEDRYYIEKMDDRFADDEPTYAKFLDSFVTYEGAPVSTVSGFGHLIGRTIEVLADGTVHPPVLVDENGDIHLNNTYSVVIGGLNYISEVVPNLVDVSTQAMGSSLGRTQRITSIKVDVYRSLGFQYGRKDDSTGEDAHVETQPFRVPANLMGVAVPLHNGWIDIDFPEGFTFDSEYFVRQNQPLPLTVRGVVDQVEVHE